MNKEIVIRSINSAVDFAVLHDGKLIELQKEKDNNKFEYKQRYDSNCAQK